MRRAERLACGFLAAIVVALALVSLAAQMTWPSINSNIASGVEGLAAEPASVDWYSMPISYDPFSDAVKLNITMHDGAKTTVRDSLIGMHYSFDPDDNLDALGSLAHRAESGEIANARYAHYWNGYMPLNRLAFAVLDYGQWRVLNIILMLGAFGAAALLIGRHLGIDLAVGFTLTLALMAPHVVVRSLHFSPVFYVVMGGVCAVVLLARKLSVDRFDIELFVALGVVTAFFDLLTAPVLTLTIPLLILLAYQVRHRAASGPSSLQKVMSATMIRSGLSWAVGYVGFWASKWVINDLFLGLSDLQEVFEHIVKRGGAGMSVADRWATVLNNVYHLVPAPLWPTEPTVTSATLVVLVLGLVPLVVWGALALTKRTSVSAAARMWPILAVSLIPGAWLFLAAEHSFVHAFFTFRVLWATAFSCWVWFALTVNSDSPTEAAPAPRADESELLNP